MDTQRLNQQLRNEAANLGMCDEWSKLWHHRNWSEEHMAEQMFKAIDFCLQHHWPSNEFISKNFDKEFRRKKNVFVDDKYSIVNPEHALALGESEIKVRYNAWGCGRIYVRDHSRVEVSATGWSFVIVHLFENAYIEAKQEENARIVLVKHSADVTIVADKDIKICEEYDYLT